MTPVKISGDGVTACHVVALPYPGRGHINPMMNLCKLLTGSDPGLVITFVVTEEWLNLLGSDNKPAAVHFATIPNVLPSEANRGSDMGSFVSAILTKMEDPVERLLDNENIPPVHVIIADTFLSWAADIGNRRNIPVASFWPMPASVFSIFHTICTRIEHNPPFDPSESGETRIDWIPGVSSIRLNDLPSIIRMENQWLFRLVRSIFSKIPRYQYLLFSSIYEVESQVMEALSLPMAVYTIGPMIPYLNLKEATRYSSSDQPDYVKWLVSQPQSSVLYISFGSFLPVSSNQMDEIAEGLHRSGVRFLWVARGEAERLQKKCGEMGRVVRWCQQLKVLCHTSIGGFWSHCGWNSTMEAIVAGLPVIAMPLMMDQMTIRKHIVDDWKIGIDAKRGKQAGEVLKSSEVAELVKKFMDSDSNERKKMMRRSSELRAATMAAVSDGGSSRENLNAFLSSFAH